MNPARAVALGLALVVGVALVVTAAVVVVCYAVLRLGVGLFAVMAAHRRAELVASGSDALPAMPVAVELGGGAFPPAAVQHPRPSHPRCRRG